MSISALTIGAGMGEVTALFGLTPRTVRFYEERGLITTTRDHRNGRRFDAHARENLRLIAQLRRAGLPLAEIRILLEGWRNGEVRDVLTTARHRIEAKRNDLKRQLSSIAQVEAWLDSQFLQTPARSQPSSAISRRAAGA